MPSSRRSPTSSSPCLAASQRARRSTATTDVPITARPSAARRQRLALFAGVCLLLLGAGLVAAWLSAGSGVLDGVPLNPRRTIILAGIVGIGAFIVCLLILSLASDDGKLRELRQAPGYDLR